MDTIFAQATAQGRAGVAVVRISGPGALGAAKALAGDLPAKGRALRRLRDRDGMLLDEALVLTFPEGRSFTGEETVELHLHGSSAVMSAVLRVLGDQPGLRMAEAGEFTRRAMENGRLDLAEVEGLADLVDAETEAQRRQALAILGGETGRRAEAWRADLLRAAMLIEATIDFVEEDVPVDVFPEVTEIVTRVATMFEAELAGFGAAERVRSGFEVAIVGPPNVGKSSLLNRLAGREAAITSDIAGTTRDVIEVRMDLAGLAVTFLDTAGLRDASDAVERIGIARAQNRATQADLRLHLLEPGGAPILAAEADDIILVSKADIHDGGDISAVTGEGVDRLLDRIGAVLSERVGNAGVIVRERHRRAIDRARDALRRGLTHIRQGETEADMSAEEIRTAIRSVESLVGRIDVEDVLGEIFSSFCIGK